VWSIWLWPVAVAAAELMVMPLVAVALVVCLLDLLE
jgi:hypothetical protein